MSLDQEFALLQTMLYQAVEKYFQEIAKFFGYPENPGMPISFNFNNESYLRSRFLESLPVHKTSWPPMQRPETWLEVIVGPVPKVETLPRYIYENSEEGYYNFYIENYKNIYFLPDWLSEFLQVRLNLCLDLTVLESIREVLFAGLVIYGQILVFRIAQSWFLSINPYIFPWYYLSAAVDWAEDIFQGIVPSVLGINITGNAFLGMLGIVGDGLNHLVFTMPFLPSEGEESKLLINQQLKDVVIFHYLPILWYRHPIPNDIRKFWYQQRPDILDYMQKVYKDLNVKFLPDSIVESFTFQKLVTHLTIPPKILEKNLADFISTEIVSNNHLLTADPFLSYLTSIHKDFYSLFLTNI